MKRSEVTSVSLGIKGIFYKSLEMIKFEKARIVFQLLLKHSCSEVRCHKSEVQKCIPKSPGDPSRH
jgi:hypothetical protein